MEISDCISCVTGLLPGVRRGRALDTSEAVRRPGHEDPSEGVRRPGYEDPREVMVLEFRTEDSYHYEEQRSLSRCDRVIQRSCAYSPDNILSVLYRYVRVSPSMVMSSLSPQ